MTRRVATLSLVALLGACAAPPTNNDTTQPGDVQRGDVVVRDDVEYQGDVIVMESFPVQIRGRVTITNRGSTARTIVFPDGCVALLRAYHQGQAAPIWDQASEVGCTMALVELSLAPGESRIADTPTASAADILDDQHPDGRYRITIYLRPDQGTVEVDGGTVDLAIPR